MTHNVEERKSKFLTTKNWSAGMSKPFSPAGECSSGKNINKWNYANAKTLKVPQLPETV